jgi:hypothetical protein
LSDAVPTADLNVRVAALYKNQFLSRNMRNKLFCAEC